MKKDNIFIFIIILISIASIIEWGVDFSTIFIIVSMLLIYLINPFKKISKKNKYLNLFYHIYKALIIFFVISFIVVESMIFINFISTKNIDNTQKVDYAIVLGAGLNGDKVSKTLKSRLDKLIEYYNKHEDIKIIVSGAKGKNEIISEAQAMYNYLVDKGINKEKIIKEDKATTTLENIIYSKEILMKYNKENERVVIVTNDYHLFRARLIANILDLKNEGLSSQSSISGRIYYMIREYPTTIIDIVRSLYLKNK